MPRAMEQPVSPADGSAPATSGVLVPVALLLALCAWQAWMTLTLFGDDAVLDNLLDERPILSGRHAQHLYLGTVGAEALQSTGCGSCYDPAFQAGYPKTPISDGARFAELFLFIAGDGYQPAAHKIGLALLCLLVP